MTNRLEAVEGELRPLQGNIEDTMTFITEGKDPAVRAEWKSRLAKIINNKNELQTECINLQVDIERKRNEEKVAGEQLRNANQLIERMEKLLKQNQAAKLRGDEEKEKRIGKERRELRLALREQLRRLLDCVEVFAEEKAVILFYNTELSRAIMRDDNGSLYTVDWDPKNKIDPSINKNKPHRFFKSSRTMLARTVVAPWEPRGRPEPSRACQKMPHLWKSAKSADFHKLLGKAPPKSGGPFSHFPQAPIGVYF